MIKRNLLLLSNSGQGALKPFPEKFELPMSITAGEQETEFFRTDRVKTIRGEVCPIYVQGRNFQLDINQFADPVVEKSDDTMEQQAVADSKSDTDRVENLRKILSLQIDWYREYSEKEETGEVDSSYVYDQMYEIFQDNLSRGEFVAIIEELL